MASFMSSMRLSFVRTTNLASIWAPAQNLVVFETKIGYNPIRQNRRVTAHGVCLLLAIGVIITQVASSENPSVCR